MTFEHYAKGCHPLGGLVETCVKMVRQILRCSIKNYVLEFRDFEFVVAQTIHMVNRRPIAFQEGLRDVSNETVPDPITPERLLHGFDLTSINLIPELQPDPESDPDWLVNSDPVSKIQETYNKLKKIRGRLNETYHSEFLGQLLKQAVNEKNRYKPVTHNKLEKGDIVLIREDNCKPINFPMAVVKDTKTNINGEVTEVNLMKGTTREIVRRHVTSLIPILSQKEMLPTSKKIVENSLLEGEKLDGDILNSSDNTPSKRRSKRKAALASKDKTSQMLADPSTLPFPVYNL